MDSMNKPRFDDNNQEGFDVSELTKKQGQPATKDDITHNHGPFDHENVGEPIGIGNENFEADGGADLGFDETDVVEGKDRDYPLRRPPGGSTSDGSNESAQ